MIKHFIKAAAFAVLPAVFIFVGCDYGKPRPPYVSTLNRPAAIDIAVVDYKPSADEEALARYYPGEWSYCLGMDKRPYAFIANSSGDSLARLDICSGHILNANIKGNPYVVSHIPTGKFPVEVAVSLPVDGVNLRVFVANAGENSLTIIDPKKASPLQNQVKLSSHPSKLAVTPSFKTWTIVHHGGLEEDKIYSGDHGDVYVALAGMGKVAHVVLKQLGGDDLPDGAPGSGDESVQEIWEEKGFTSLETELTPEPVPGGMAVDIEREALYVSDMNHDYFHVVDLHYPGYPSRVYDVHGPQRDCALSPDGRFLYLAKLDKNKIAVFDLEENRYVDTNEELPSHLNSPPPTEQFDYDIKTEDAPRKIVFADVAKSFYGGGAIEDGDLDDEEGEDAEADGGGAEADIETETGEVETETGGGKSGEPFPGARLDNLDHGKIRSYAYSIGHKGGIQVIDAHRDLHEIYDSNPDNPAEFRFLSGDELDIDNRLCMADIEPKIHTGRTPEGLWTLSYNGVVSGSDLSASGRFDTANNRFYDDNLDFSTLVGIHAKGGDPESIPGDWLEILTSPKSEGEDDLGCVRELDGSYVQLKTVKLEILDVTPEYLVYDPNGIEIERCFNNAVEYYILANDNYLVYMTELNLDGIETSAPIYQGRAVNGVFRPGTTISSEEYAQALSWDRQDWKSYMCTTQEIDENGDEIIRYECRHDVTAVSPDGETIEFEGIRCINPWDDGDEGILSFSNDFISFTICQNDEKEDIKLKQSGSFDYSFRTYSAVNQIQVRSGGGYRDTYVGSLLEDAVLLNFYPSFPRLYVVDSSEERIYVIDLTTDRLLTLVY